MTTVAVIEDNNTMRSVLVDLINSVPGYNCVCACSSSTEALSVLPKHHPEVALMDIHLPDESGIACTARLTQKMPALQVIMVTVYKDSERIFQALKAGATGYLIKSSPPEQILAAIRDVYSGSAPLSGPIALKVVEHFHKIGPSPKEAENLSPRERQVLDLLSKGFTYKEIGTKLNIGAETVRSYVKTLCQKLHVRSRLEAIAKHC